MTEAWEMIRHVAEVLGMIFLPILGWMLLTLTNHSKKIILLEERVNETITHRLSQLEEHIDEVHQKVDNTYKTISQMSVEINNFKHTNENRDKKLDSILEVVQQMSKK
jgi:signal transduction histidine kinase